MKYSCVVAIIKDEYEDYLKEWVNWNFMLGFQKIIILDNDSKKPIKKVLKNYKDVYIYKIKGKNKQIQSYNEAIKNLNGLFKWVAFIDSDEFIVLKNGYKNINNFLENYEKNGSSSINWQIFGSNGLKKKTNKKQTHKFIKKTPKDFYLKEGDFHEKGDYKGNYHIKNIVQPEKTKKAITPHYFKFFNDYHSVNEYKDMVDSPFSQYVSIDYIQINHYWTRSEEEFKQKINRGRPLKNVKSRNMKQFNNINKYSTIDDFSAINLYNKIKK